MSDVVRVTEGTEQVPHGQTVAWFCPACREIHNVPTPRWTWNGDLARPTISPSVLHFNTYPEDGRRITRCHYFIRAGCIEFCSDSPHALAGQTVEMIPVEEWPK